MERVIKFKAQVKYNGNHLHSKEWIEGHYWFCHRTERHIMKYHDIDKYGTVVRVLDVEIIPSTVCQYTGLKGKNGVEIFEGDKIVSQNVDEGGEYIISYQADRDYPAFDVEPDLDCDCNGLSYLMACDNIEVIGSIHDDKEAD